MDSSQLVIEGVWLMIFGMGTVFVFLTVLVFATGFMSKLINRYAPAPVAKAPAPSTAPTTGAPDQAQLIAVLSAAIHRYRAERKAKK